MFRIDADAATACPKSQPKEKKSAPKGKTKAKKSAAKKKAKKTGVSPEMIGKSTEQQIGVVIESKDCSNSSAGSSELEVQPQGLKTWISNINL